MRCGLITNLEALTQPSEIGPAAKLGSDPPEVGFLEVYPIIEEVKGGSMAGKTILDKMSICIPQDKLEQRPVERLMKFGEKRDHSVYFSMVEGFPECLSREERMG